MESNTTRRRFLLKCSVLTAATAAAPVSAWALPSRRLATALDRVSFQSFSACVGARFRVVLPGAPDVRLELVKAQPRMPVAADLRIGGIQDAANEKFSLVFRGALGQPLAQDSYTFVHGRTGQFLLFIAPVISKDNQHRYYEAVFNRPQPAAPKPAKAGR